jgi:hypothetical protein
MGVAEAVEAGLAEKAAAYRRERLAAQEGGAGALGA